jgi:hypothetical protein
MGRSGSSAVSFSMPVAQRLVSFLLRCVDLVLFAGL